MATTAFESSGTENENLVMVHMKKLRITFDKQIYTRFANAILDVSEVIMYDFHYRHNYNG